MSEKSIHIHLTVAVPANNSTDFRALMDELVTRTKKESGTLVYEWYASEDGLTWHILERYADAENGDLHVKGFAENYAGRFFELVDSCNVMRLFRIMLRRTFVVFSRVFPLFISRSKVASIDSE